MQPTRPTLETMPRFRLRLLPPMLLCAAALSACGGESGSMLDAVPAQPPIPPAPGTLPAPLGKADIALYLQVMREAARRVQHPTAAEKRMLARADAITAAANRGAAPARDSGDALDQALAFHTQMDLEIARSRHLDTARYQALSVRIEDESGELHCNAAAAVPDPALKPHVAEIEHLVGIVRNPGPAGSAPAPSACADGDTGASS